MTSPTQSAAALVRAYRDDRYMAHDLRSEKAEVLAALLDIIDAQRKALVKYGRHLQQMGILRAACPAHFDGQECRCGLITALALTDPERPAP